MPIQMLCKPTREKTNSVRDCEKSNFLLVRTNKWESKLAFILVHYAILKFQTHSLDLFRTYQRTTVENPQPHWSHSFDFRVHCCQTAFYLRRRERKPQPLPFCCHCALVQGISSCNICKEYVQERNSCRKLRAHCLNSKSDTEWICRKMVAYTLSCLLLPQVRVEVDSCYDRGCASYKQDECLYGTQKSCNQEKADMAASCVCFLRARWMFLYHMPNHTAWNTPKRASLPVYSRGGQDSYQLNDN